MPAVLTHLDVRVVSLVLNLNSSPLVERHGQVAIRTAITAKLVKLGRLDRDGEGKRFEVAGHRVA